jgi:hypothetical protein
MCVKAEAEIMNLLQRLKKFGSKEVFIGTESLVEKGDEGIVRDYEQRGFNFYPITSDAPPELIDRLGQMFKIEYFLKHYPKNKDARQTIKYIRSRLDDGEVCIAALYKDDIAFMEWLGFEKTCHYNKIVLARNLSIDFSTTVLCYNSYAKEQYRGQALQNGAKHFQLLYLGRRNYLKTLGFIGARNTASLCNSAKIGRLTGVVLETNYLIFKDYHFLPIDFAKS